ncbi:hypothetical protein [Rhodococcus maanshanensis]|uniref:Uncharacterized protein n=1 Tax=Rhodococcus maanshanensis TaxID=183556 RepID=A0A1H7YM18_9NOCA|nr:hypothetical protein [Rhodococcus maanshanensis]SEM47282.1 hypothetical protein SAMN05444583_14213 [Rhodococcus maanshanensis]
MGSAEFANALDAISTFTGAISDVTGGAAAFIGSVDGLVKPKA